MIYMTKYVNAMIDNAGVYSGGGGSRIWRHTHPGQYSSCVMAHQDVENINEAAVKCIDIIDKHAMPK